MWVEGITPHAADLANPTFRAILENAFETIMDAGLNPEDLAGTKTAIIGSVFHSECGEVWMKGNFAPDKNGLLV